MFKPKMFNCEVTSRFNGEKNFYFLTGAEASVFSGRLSDKLKIGKSIVLPAEVVSKQDFYDFEHKITRIQ